MGTATGEQDAFIIKLCTGKNERQELEEEKPERKKPLVTVKTK